jgi:hypothetical protein
LGGDMLQTIFGVATQEEMKRLEHKIMLLSDYHTDSENALKVTIKQLHKNTLFLKDLTKQINNVTKLVTQIQDEHLDIQLCLLVHIQVELMQEYLHHIHTVHLSVLQIRDLAHRKETSLELLSYENIQEIVAQAEEEFKLQPIFALKRNELQNFMLYTWTLAVDDYHLMVVIPLFAKETFKAYKIHQFPTAYVNHTLRQRIVSTQKDPYVFLSETRFSYSELSQEKFEHCIHRKKYLICSPVTSIQHYNEDNEICQLSLIRNSPKNCIFATYTSKSPSSLYLNKQYFISLAEPSQAKITCRNQIKVMYLNGSFSLPNGCKIHTSNFELFSPDNIVIRKTLPLFFVRQENVLLNITGMNLETNNFSVNTELQLPEWDETITKLAQHMEDTKNKITLFRTTFIGASIWGVVASIIILILLYLYFCGIPKCRQRHTTQENANLTTPPTAETSAV